MSDWKESLKSLVRDGHKVLDKTDDGGLVLEWYADNEDCTKENILSIYFDENGSLQEATIELDGEVSHVSNYGRKP